MIDVVWSLYKPDGSSVKLLAFLAVTLRLVVFASSCASLFFGLEGIQSLEHSQHGVDKCNEISMVGNVSYELRRKMVIAPPQCVRACRSAIRIIAQKYPNLHDNNAK